MDEATRPEQQRQSFRVDVHPECILDFSLWHAPSAEPHQCLKPDSLGRPLLQQNSSRKHTVRVSNISAGGVGIHIHSKRLTTQQIKPLRGKQFFVRLKLATRNHADPISLLCLAQVRRITGTTGSADLALQFIAKARFIRRTGRLQFFPIKDKGIDKLAAWITPGAPLDGTLYQKNTSWVRELD